MQLLDKFPIEGGQKDPKQRIIPFLPGKLWMAPLWGWEVTWGEVLIRWVPSSPFLDAAHLHGMG